VLLVIAVAWPVRGCVQRASKAMAGADCDAMFA